MTKADWKIVKSAWGEFYGQIEIIADGHKLTLKTEALKSLNNPDRSGMKLFMAVYVNDYIKSDYMSESSEVGRKFYFRWESTVYKAKKLKQLKKQYGSGDPRFQQEFFSSRLPYWRSFSDFKKQLKLNCDNIELVRVITNYPLNEPDFLFSKKRSIN